MKHLINSILYLPLVMLLTAMRLINPAPTRRRTGYHVGRAFTCDTSDPMALKYRMNASVAGDVNRSHPANIEAVLIDKNNPPLAFGIPVVIDPTTQGIRPIGAGDGALTDIYGITVRPFPFQTDQAAAGSYGAQGFGGGAPALNQAADVLRTGYIKCLLGGSAAASKGGRVYVWFAASTGTHVQGNFEAAPTTGSTFVLPQTVLFNGPADSDGNVEISRI